MSQETEEQVGIQHVGLRPERQAENPRERVFAEKWTKENEEQPFGGSLLQTLLVTKFANFPYPCTPEEAAFEVTQRDATIVATVVQWLGSPVGWCFLDECLQECGYRLERLPQKDRP